MVEIDGVQHAEDPLQRWDDIERDLDLDLGLDGYRTLRFPTWLVRTNPGLAARKSPRPCARRDTAVNAPPNPARLRYPCAWQGAVAQQVRAADS